MRCIIIVFLLALLNVSCNADNNMNTQGSLDTVSKTLGIGWLEISTAYPVPMRKNLTDSLPYDIMKFKIKKSFFKPNNTNLWKVVFKTKVNMQPYHIGWQNGRTVIFRVVDSVNNTYRVVVNEETFETCYININEYLAYNQKVLAVANPYLFVYKYETWLNYLKRVAFIEKNHIVIYNKPNGEIIFENKKNNFLPFAVVDMEDDWIKLEKLDIYKDRYKNGINYEGWTRWKEGEKIQIQIQIIEQFLDI